MSEIPDVGSPPPSYAPNHRRHVLPALHPPCDTSAPLSNAPVLPAASVPVPPRRPSTRGPLRRPHSPTVHTRHPASRRSWCFRPPPSHCAPNPTLPSLFPRGRGPRVRPVHVPITEAAVQEPPGHALAQTRRPAMKRCLPCRQPAASSHRCPTTSDISAWPLWAKLYPHPRPTAVGADLVADNPRAFPGGATLPAPLHVPPLAPRPSPTTGRLTSPSTAPSPITNAYRPCPY